MVGCGKERDKKREKNRRRRQKKTKNSTGQARGLEYLKRRDRYIPENPSNQNIFGDAKRFTKVNAFLHVSKKKKEKKEKKRNASSPS